MAIIRSLLVKVAADITQLQQGLGQAQSAMQSAASKLNSIGASLTKTITLPLVGIGVAALKAGMDFEQGMSNVKALGGATGEQMKQLQDLAIKMGAETKYSAVDAAKGIEELMKAGVSTTNILNGGLKGALSLAAAGDLELAEAAEIASTALNAFKNDGLEVSDAANILAGAANASATDVRELKFGLSSVSAVAASVGLSFKDTTTALAVFAQNGLKGSDAGTSLKTMLMNLQPQTDKQVALFQKLNLVNEKGQSIFFNSAGKLKSMADIAGILNSKLKGMTDAQRLQTMETIFGSDAIRAANILYKEGADGVNNMKSEMSKTTAEEVAAEKMNNLKGSLEQFKGSLETIAVQIYNMNSGPLKSFVDELTVLANKFLELSPNTQQFVLIIAGVAASIGPVLMMVGQIANGLSVLAGVFSFLISPVGLVIAAIAALTAGFIYLFNTNETFRTSVLAVWEQIKIAAQTIFEGLASFWKENGDTIKSNLQQVWFDIKTILSTVWNIIKSVATVVFNALQNFWDKNGSEILAMFQNIWNTIQTILSAVWTVIKTVAMTLFGALQEFFINHGTEIQNALTTVWNVIWSVIQPIWNTILSVAMTVFGFLKDFFQQNGDTIKGIFSNTFELIYQIVSVVCQRLQAFWQQWGPLITAIFQTIWDVIKTIFQTAWNLIKTVVQSAVNIISGIIKFALGLIKGDWQGAWEGICEIAKGVWELIKGVIKAAVDILVGLFNAFKNNVLDIFKGIWNGVKGFINCIIGGINKMIGALNGLQFSFPDWVPGLGGKSFGLNIPTVPMLAAGGIVTEPTLSMIGEGTEPEAVMPLSKLSNFVDNGRGRGNIIQVILDGKVVQEYIDNGLGSASYARGF